MKPVLPPEALAPKLRRRLWLERSLFTLTLLGAAAAWAYPLVYPTVWAVTVDGVPVVALEQRDLADSIVRRLQRGEVGAAAAGAAENAPPRRRIEVTAADPTQVDVASEEGAFRALTPVLGLPDRRAVVRVQGVPVIALADEGAAEDTLSEAKARFAARAGELDTAPEFKEEVTVRVEPAARSLWCDTTTAAADRLLQGEGGQPLTVVTRVRRSEERDLPFSTVTQPDRNLYIGKRDVRRHGRPGRERVLFVLRCENGQEVAREPVSRAVTQPPVPEVVAVGALPRPVRVARGRQGAKG